MSYNEELEAHYEKLRKLAESFPGRPVEPGDFRPKKVNSFTMLISLWKVTPRDCRTVLISEFIFNPEALRVRYENEQSFQNQLKRSWF